MKKSLVILFFATLTLCLSCGGSKESGNSIQNSQDSQQIRDLILKTPKISVANPSALDGDVIVPKKSLGFTGSGPDKVENFEEQRKLTKTLERFVAFNPNVDSVYPGALVQGKSLPDGVLTPLVTARTPLTITVSDFISNNPSATYSKEVKHPSLANVTAAVSSVISQNLQEDQPSKISYNETSYSSVEQAFLKLGASYSWTAGKISGSFQKSSQEYRTGLMVRFIQSYYTVSCDAPTAPNSFIAQTTPYNDFKLYAGDGNPPAYVASVTYGREVWMLIESNNSEQEVKAAINAAYNAAVSKGNVDLDVTQKKVLNESYVQVMIVGGNGPAAVEVLAGDHFANLKQYLMAGANYSRKSPGVIISYTARYLSDNDIARVSSSADYTIKTSEGRPDLNLESIRVTWDTTGDGKDGDSQPVIEVFDKNGRRIGELACCSSGNSGSDVWGAGRKETRNVNVLVGGLTMNDLAKGRFSAGRNANGNDDWDYNVTVDFIYAGNQVVSKSCGARNYCGADW